MKQNKDYIKLVGVDSSGKRPIDSLYSAVVSSFPNRTPLSLNQLKLTKSTDYQFFRELSYLSERSQVSLGRLELFILDPRYFVFFHKYGYNEIEFVRCIFSEEIYNTSNSAADLRKLARKDHTALLNSSNLNRYFSIRATSLIEEKSGRDKFQYQSTEYSLKFKNKTRDELPGCLKAALADKDKQFMSGFGPTYEIR